MAMLKNVKYFGPVGTREIFGVHLNFLTKKFFFSILNHLRIFGEGEGMAPERRALIAGSRRFPDR